MLELHPTFGYTLLGVCKFYGMTTDEAKNIVEFFKSKLSKYELMEVNSTGVRVLDVDLIDDEVLIYFDGEEKIAALEHFEGEDGDMIQIVYKNSTILTDEFNLCKYVIEQIR
jgi:hypothetical protein